MNNLSVNVVKQRCNYNFVNFKKKEKSDKSSVDSKQKDEKSHKKRDIIIIAGVVTAIITAIVICKTKLGSKIKNLFKKSKGSEEPPKDNGGTGKPPKNDNTNVDSKNPNEEITTPKKPEKSENPENNKIQDLNSSGKSTETVLRPSDDKKAMNVVPATVTAAQLASLNELLNSADENEKEFYSNGNLESIIKMNPETGNIIECQFMKDGKTKKVILEYIKDSEYIKRTILYKEGTDLILEIFESDFDNDRLTSTVFREDGETVNFVKIFEISSGNLLQTVFYKEDGKTVDKII